MKRLKNKILIILLVLTIFAGIGLIVKKNQENTDITYKERGIQQTQDSSSETLDTPRQNSYSSKEFFGEENLPKYLPESAEVISQTGDALIFDSENYRIMYHDSRDEYAIYIYASPFSTVRAEAEEKFLTLMNINEGQACLIKVIIKTPESVNSEEAKQNHFLSFCE